MEAYLEALDVGVLRATHKASQNLRIPPTFKAMRLTTRSGMQRLETPSLEAFARIYLTVCGTTQTPMHYGQTFVRSMREPRVSMRNAITL